MEKNIKAEIERKIFTTKLLNENALLLISKNSNETNSTASVRYIEDDCIKETIIAELTPSTTAVEFNDMMVAVFKKEDESSDDFQLTAVYDLEHYEFVENDFIKIIYDCKAKEGQARSYIKTL